MEIVAAVLTALVMAVVEGAIIRGDMEETQHKLRRFLSSPANTTLASGTAGVLACSMSGDGVDPCRWEADGKVVGINSTRHSILTSEEGKGVQTCNLGIDPVQPGDQGDYTCVVGHHVSRAGHVKVVSPPGAPHILEGRLGELVEVGEGGQVTERPDGQVELTCVTLGARPPADIVWRHGDGTRVTGEMVDLVTKMDSVSLFKTQSTLRMVASRAETVECVAYSEAFPEERVSSPVQLRVRSLPQVTITATTPGPVEAGGGTVLQCSASAYPPVTSYTWTLAGRTVEGEETDMLRLEQLDREADGAMVTCSATNTLGSGTGTMALVVRHGPRIVTHPSNVFARSGAAAALTCLAEGNPPPRYVWLQGGQLVGYGETLTVTATADTEGDYTCKVFGAGSSSVSSDPATLSLLRAPTVLLEPSKTAVEGEDVLLGCRLAPPVAPDTTLLWLRGDEPVAEESPKVNLIPSAGALGLLIRGVAEEDWGRWTCFASNTVGTDHAEVELVMEGIDYIYIALLLNMVAALSLFGVVLVCRRVSRSNVELMEATKQQLREDSPIYKTDDSRLLEHLLVGDTKLPIYSSNRVSASSTMADVSSIEGDVSMPDNEVSKLSCADRDISMMTDISILSAEENATFETEPNEAAA